MSDVSEKILDTIKKEAIRPTPKWHFLLKNYFIWALFAFSILLGSLAFSVVLFFITDNDWDVYKYLDRDFFEYIIISLPYFWLLFILVFLGVAYYNYKNTKSGYKYNAYIVIMLSVIISIFIGMGLFSLGFGEKIDSTLGNNIPYYKQRMLERKKDLWHHPEKGVLIGHIMELKENKNFTLKDFNQKTWDVNGEDAIWKGRATPQKGGEIKIIGKQESLYRFRAKIIKSGIRGRINHHKICQ